MIDAIVVTCTNVWQIPDNTYKVQFETPYGTYIMITTKNGSRYKKNYRYVLTLKEE